MTRDRLMRALRVAVAVAVLAFVGYTIGEQWSAVTPHLAELSALWMLLALLAVVAGFLCTMLSWRALLADLGSPLPLRPALRIFFLSQLGKYIPGSIWPVVAQMELGRGYDVPRKRSATAGLVTIALSLIAAALVGVACVPFIDNVPPAALLVLLALPIGAVVLHPPIFSAIVNRVLRLIRKEPLEHPLSRAGELRALGWAAAAWLAFGVQAWAIGKDLGATRSGLLPVAVGGFALAWTAGFLFVLAPAGIGVREAVLVAVFAGYLSGGDDGAAYALALISRLLMSLGDVIWAVAAVVLSRGQRTAAPAAPLVPSDAER
ncbi:MAG: lysylphosphatidylglycerol synthase domain-containing protein [Mycobacteriales bacterium]